MKRAMTELLRFKKKIKKFDYLLLQRLDGLEHNFPSQTHDVHFDLIHFHKLPHLLRLRIHLSVLRDAPGRGLKGDVHEGSVFPDASPRIEDCGFARIGIFEGDGEEEAVFLGSGHFGDGWTDGRKEGRQAGMERSKGMKWV